MVNGNYRFGTSVIGLGDINNDGVDDFAMTTHEGDISPQFRNSVDPNTLKIHIKSEESQRKAAQIEVLFSFTMEILR